MVVGVGSPVAHLAVQCAILRVYECAVVYPHMLALIGDEVGTVDVDSPRANEREVADDDVLAGGLDMEDSRLVGQRIDSCLLILQLHAGFLGEEGPSVAGQGGAIGQSASVLIGAAQSFKVLTLQVGIVLVRQEELRTQSGIIDADERLVLR